MFHVKEIFSRPVPHANRTQIGKRAKCELREMTRGQKWEETMSTRKVGHAERQEQTQLSSVHILAPMKCNRGAVTDSGLWQPPLPELSRVLQGAVMQVGQKYQN